MDMARAKKMISTTFDPKLIERLDKWIESQRFPLNRNDVIAEAIREFLERNGG